MSWLGSSALGGGASQSAVNLRCKIAGDLHEILHLNRTCTPRPVCCISHDRLLTVISPECSGDAAAPEIVKLRHYSEAQAWDFAV